MTFNIKFPECGDEQKKLHLEETEGLFVQSVASRQRLI